MDASDRLYPGPAPPAMSARPVQPGYSFQAVERAGYPRFPVRPPKTRSPRRRLITSQPGVVHKTASAYDTFQPAPLDGVGSPRWVTPQSSAATLPPPNAPVAPMPSFRSEEAVPPPDSVASHWGCTVLVGSVQNTWQPVDHQAWGKPTGGLPLLEKANHSFVNASFAAWIFAAFGFKIQEGLSDRLMTTGKKLTSDDNDPESQNPVRL